MTKYDWDRQLRKALKELPADERQRVFEYYDELFEDKMDSGEKEEAIIASFGSPDVAAHKILSDYHAYLGRADDNCEEKPNKPSEIKSETGGETSMGDLKASDDVREYCAECDYGRAKTGDDIDINPMGTEESANGKYSGVTKLKIDVSCSDVVVRKAEKFEIDLGTDGEDSKCTADVAGDTLYIKEKGASFWKGLLWGGRAKPITIGMPFLESVSFKSVKRGCEITGFDMRRATMETVGGDLKLKGCDSDYLSLLSTTGDISVHGGKHGSVNTNTTSGDVRLKNLDAVSVTVTSMSGDIECSETKVSDKALFKTVGGDIEIDKLDCGNVECKTVSGDNTLRLVGKETDYTVNVRSVTGGVEAPRGGNGTKRVAVSAVTGSIDLRMEN